MTSAKGLDAYYTRSQKETRLSEFANHLKSALDAVTPTSAAYARVSVLAIHWTNDDMEVEGLENSLLELFTGIYNFEVDRFKIPLVLSYNLLTQKLNEWSMAKGGSKTLRIIVYSGHANSAGTTAKTWLMAGRADRKTYALLGPKVDWLQVQGVIRNVPGDVLYIFDCCSAATAAMEDGPEVLAACGWEQTASISLEFFFTQALIDTLRALNGTPQTVGAIYSHIFRNCRQNQVGACPVHVVRKGCRSITLEKLQSQPSRLSREMKQIQASKAAGSHRVLLSIRTQYDLSTEHVDLWKAWLTTNMPPGILAVDVTLEAVFRGSGVALITIPIELWTMLSATDQRYKFIAHVTSNNVLPQLSRELAMRPAAPTGRENQPLHRQRKSIG